MLDSVLSAGGYRVGTFTSPHLVRYNERIRIAGEEISDAALVAAFERIDAARGDTSLTFFEFNTLAALLSFETADLDAIVLEVGLGGRLDAVNVVDADVALLSSVSLDHCEWLGADVESIGREKAGIFRSDRVAIFGSRSLPSSVATEAVRIGARLERLGVDYDFDIDGDRWTWRGKNTVYGNLPRPALFGAVQMENASAVIAVLVALASRLPLTADMLEVGLRGATLKGRFELVVRDGCEWILDVAHNPAAAETLARNLGVRPIDGRTIAVCGMFADKDVSGVVTPMLRQIDGWITAGVSGPRALPSAHLADRIAAEGGSIEAIEPSVAAACARAGTLAQSGDRIVVFGSFHTVGPALEWLERSRDARP
jgi:dihydrofolate synthase/folylpolyglutamate synthase